MELKKYDRPLIKRHVVGYPAKGGMPSVSKVIREIDGIRILDLIKEYGTPIFVVSESSLRTAYRRLLKAMGFYFSKPVLAWSYKTNWIRAVCAVLHQEGAWAEVVSEFEYEKARGLGIVGPRIIFNGPFKPRQALTTAFKDGAFVNLDSLDEILLAEEVAKELALRPKVGIRINLIAGNYPTWARFGFNYESGEALAMAKRIQKGGSLDLTGLHCHIGTFVIDPYCYKEATQKLVKLAGAIKETLGRDITLLNLGGGFASKNTLINQYFSGEEATPPFEDYVATIAEGFKGAPWNIENQPTLMLETGRGLVDEAGYLLTRVAAVKRLPTGIRALVMDAGVNLLMTAFWYRHEIFPVNEPVGSMEETVVYGPLCMNIDVLRESVLLPSLRAGDPLAIWPVGAYNMTQWLQFIRLRPKVMMVGTQGEVEVIRQEDLLEEIISKEPLPERLAY
jgi:diaminopimelate decarboxylase